MASALLSHARFGPCLLLQYANADALISLRGGQVLSWRIEGRERLYVSPLEVSKPKAVVRGGIPVIFPQFAECGPGPRHGFARNSRWVALESTQRNDSARACLQLEPSPETLAVWNHRFQLDLTVELSKQNLALTLEVRNTDTHAWDFSAALHSYWALDPGQVVYLDTLAPLQFQDNSEGGCASPAPGPLEIGAEIERLYPAAPDILDLEFVAPLRLRSQNWPSLMVWNPGRDKAETMADLGNGEEQQFLCVEPLQYTPVMLEPGQTWNARHDACAGILP